MNDLATEWRPSSTVVSYDPTTQRGYFYDSRMPPELLAQRIAEADKSGYSVLRGMTIYERLAARVFERFPRWVSIW